MNDVTVFIYLVFFVALFGATFAFMFKSMTDIQKEMNRYIDIFKRHDLTKLASAKPGLIEPRINKGTKDVFDSIEEDSRNIDSLDDGLQLQSDTK